MREAPHAIPHIYADNVFEAYRALGYACAEDRFLQMTWQRLIIKGRVSEFLGPDNGTKLGAHLDHDRRMRLFGYQRLAEELYANIDGNTRALLDHYAEGVNEYLATTDFAAHQHPLFSDLSIPIEPWEPEDSIAAWLRVARLYTPKAEPGDEIDNLWDAAHNGCGAAQATLFRDTVFDEEAAAVLQDDIPAARVQAMCTYANDNGYPCTMGSGGAAPGWPFSIDYVDDSVHFSHAWAAKTGTNDAALLGHPQVPVRVPSDFWEAYVETPDFHVRGVTVAGSVNFLAGSNGHVAWSVTAMGMDQVDMFRLQPGTGSDTYLLDGNSVAWVSDLQPSVIKVKTPTGLVDDTPAITFRRSHWGPIVTRSSGDQMLSSKVGMNEEYAARSVPWFLLDPPSGANVPDHLIPASGFLEAYQATDESEFRAALEGWLWPALNCVFATSDGDIGYYATGALPLRQPPGAFPQSCLGGRGAQNGTTTTADWIEIVPHDLMPWVVNPASRGYVFSGNHLPVGSWYPIPFVGNGGHTLRSARIQQLLEDVIGLPGTLPSAQDVLEMNSDRGLRYAIDLATVGSHLRPSLSTNAVLALDFLEPWALGPNGGQLGHVADAVAQQSLIAREACRSIRFRIGDVNSNQLSQMILDTYGEGPSGVSYFLRSMIAKIAAGAMFSAEELQAVDLQLTSAWDTAFNKFKCNNGPCGQVQNCSPPDTWACAYRRSLTVPRNHWETTEKIGALVDADVPGFVPPTPIAVNLALSPGGAAFTDTLLSQYQVGYLLSAEFSSGAPQVQSLLPLGQTELPGPSSNGPGSPWGGTHWVDQKADWEIVNTSTNTQSLNPWVFDESLLSKLAEIALSL